MDSIFIGDSMMRITLAAALLLSTLTSQVIGAEFVYRYKGLFPEIRVTNPTQPGGGATPGGGSPGGSTPGGGNPSSGGGAAPVYPVSFAGGGNMTCALDTGGGASCWGSDGIDPFVDGVNHPEMISNSPVRVQGLSSGVRKVDASGADYGCVLMLSGTVSCFGYAGQDGTLGDGSREYQVLVSRNPDTYAIRVDGSPWAATPRAVPGLSGATDLATSNEKACAVVAGGQVSCWGWVANPVDGKVVDLPGVTGAKKVFLGQGTSCGIFENGRAGCWGFMNGSLGDGVTTTSKTPVMAVGLDGDVVDMTAGFGFACAVTDAGHVWCWGLAQYGSLGIGPLNGAWMAATPTMVPGLEGVKEISGRYETTCAIASDGVWCWGDGSSYQLGNGIKATAFSPVKIPGLTGASHGLETMHDRSCVVEANEAWCWGWNNHGKLGAGIAMAKMPYSILPIKVDWPF